jgi:hypothetical protein
VALGVLVVEAEKRSADLVQAQATLADERGRLLELVSLLRSRGVAIPSAVQAFFSPSADLRTIGSVVVSAGPWADMLDSLCADPDARIRHRFRLGVIGPRDGSQDVDESIGHRRS